MSNLQLNILLQQCIQIDFGQWIKHAAKRSFNVHLNCFSVKVLTGSSHYIYANWLLDSPPTKPLRMF